MNNGQWWRVLVTPGRYVRIMAYSEFESHHIYIMYEDCKKCIYGRFYKWGGTCEKLFYRSNDNGSMDVAITFDNPYANPEAKKGFWNNLQYRCEEDMPYRSTR